MKHNSIAAQKALALFHQTAENVPAYKDFLRKASVVHSKIKNIRDFQKYVPLVDKQNYIMKYPLDKLCWKGSLFSNHIIASSSGTTGEPFFWPRSSAQEDEGVHLHETIYRHLFAVKKQKTLVVVCFSMGEWVAGLFTVISTLGVASHDFKLNVMTPGLEKAGAIRGIKTLGQYYDQIIIAGYPPFVKDILEEGKRSGLKWSKLNIKMLMAGEAFSEEWRDYVLKEVRAQNPYSDAINIYGCAEATLLGHETPASIVIRRIYNNRPKLLKGTFGRSILPSLVQYYPERRYFENVKGELVVTAPAGIPLIRYNTGDSGGLYSFEELASPVQERLTQLVEDRELNIDRWQRLPFIYLHGRSNATTALYGVNIYPENIKAALIDRRVRLWVSGRFSMATKYSSDMDQYFVLNIELARDFIAEKTHQKLLHEVVVQNLCRLNAEFNKLYRSINKKAEPKIKLIAWGNPDYFSRDGKHKWVAKENGTR